MKLTRNDIVLISAPFLLTAFFIFIGYQILIRQTPEAKVTLPQQSTKIDILTEDETEQILPLTPIPDEINATIYTIPSNRSQLANAINSTLEAKSNTIYFSLPVDLQPDQSLILTDVHLSSEENITRWTKKSLNTAHKNGLHTILAITINATDVVKNGNTFTQNYVNFIGKWAKLATEYGASFFTPGITVGHPIYSELTPQQITYLLQSVQGKTRNHYSGYLGVNLCCSTTITSSPAGYTFITYIPTNDFLSSDLLPVATQLAQQHLMSYVLSYDKPHQRVTQAAQFTPPPNP